MSTHSLSMETHPDIADLRARWDELGQSTVSQMTDSATLLAGLFVAACPWIVGFSGSTSLTINNLIAGLAVAVLAAGFASSFSRTHGMAVLAPLLGAWIIISPWVVAGVSTTTGMIWANVVGGAVVCLCGLGVTGMGMMRRT